MDEEKGRGIWAYAGGAGGDPIRREIFETAQKICSARRSKQYSTVKAHLERLFPFAHNIDEWYFERVGELANANEKEQIAILERFRSGTMRLKLSCGAVAELLLRQANDD